MKKFSKILVIIILVIFLFICFNFAIAYNAKDNNDEIFFDDFDTKLDINKWLVANKAWGGNNHGVVPENVLIDNGTLRLFGNGNNYTGDVKGFKSDLGTRTGACLVTKDYFGSGSYEVKAKLPKELGVCSSIWTFEYEEYYPGSEEFEKLAPDKNSSYYVVNHEIDIEMPGRPYGAKSATDYSYALCNTFVGERKNEYTSNHVKLDNPQNDGKYHIYRFDWHTGSDKESKRVDFFIDNKLIATNTNNVPTNKGRFWIGIWFPNDWAGEANFDTTEFDVDYVKITPFNEEGDVLSTETYGNDGWGDLSLVKYNLPNDNSENLFLKSNKYLINENDKIINKVSAETTLEKLKNNCSTNGKISVLNKNGKEISDSDFVGTGYKLKVLKDEESINLDIVVLGDISGDGKITATDLSDTNKACLGQIKLENIEFIACDLDENKKISVTDLSTLKQVLLGIIKSLN